MTENKEKGLAIVLHSGSFDRLYHSFSIALAALALGREVKFFVTYWALEYFRKKDPAIFNLDQEGEAHIHILENNMTKGHIKKFPEFLAEAKAMGARFFACTASMGMLNIARYELADEVDMSMGITTFLTETTNDQLLFI